MWPFKRRQKNEGVTDQLPPEVQQYYQAEHRERIGMAWLLAFLSLVLTIVVIVGIFFGGRWTWHKLTHKNQPVATTSKPKVGTPVTTSTPQTSSTSTNTPSQALQPAAPANTPVPSGPTSSTTTPQVAASPSTTSNQNLSNTGPGDTVGIFIAVSGLAMLAYQGYKRYKLVQTD